MKIVEGAN